MISGLVGCSDLWTGGERAERKAVGDAFGGDQNIGVDSEVLDGKHLPGATEAGLHFVSNKENSVLVENFFDLTEIVFRRNNDAALTQHRFGDERRHVAGCFKANHVLQALRAMASTLFRVIWPQRTICIRHRSKSDTWRVRASAFLASLVAGDAKRAPAASVKAGVQRNKFVLATVEAREFHCPFNGLG